MEGKVAVVAGSTAGIGYAIARRFAQEGAKVMVSSRKQENVDRAVEQLRSESGNLQTVEGVVCHVGKPDHRKRLIEEAVEKFGGVDFVVISAGCNPDFGRLTIDTAPSTWDKIFDVNVTSAAMLVKEALPYLKERHGCVVLMSTIGAYWNELEVGAYGASKAAILGLTKVLSVELAKHKIRVNCIAPGLIRTKFGEVIWGNEERRCKTINHVILQRMGEPEECAGTAVFLCSDDASYVTGEVVAVAGGMLSRL